MSASSNTARASQRTAFDDAVRDGRNVVPLFRRMFDDQLTPILAYRMLVKEDEREAPSFCSSPSSAARRSVGIRSWGDDRRWR